MTATDPQVAPAEGGHPELVVGEVLSIGRLSPGRLMALAAAAPDGTSDPVDRAVAQALTEDRPDIVAPRVGADDVDPASPARRYSLVRLRAMPFSDGTTRDLVVMRGDLRSVIDQADATREQRTVLRKNAQHAAHAGGRPLAVACADVAEDGSTGPFRMEGFVSVYPAGTRDPHSMEAPDSWSRVAVWSASLRLQHWSNVALIFVMSCTGYYIMDPFFGPSARAGEPTGYLMGWVRLIHITAGFCWLLVGATRVVSAFTSRDPYLRWPTLWPLKSKQDVKYLVQTAGSYAFLRKEGPLYLAHNPLQQLTYTLLYVACAVQMVTGLALFGLAKQGSWVWRLISTPVHWFGIAPVREFHAMTMFFLWAFVVVHIYLAVRADSLERHGGVSSMLNGGVWLRWGSKPVDAPEV